MGGGNRPRTAKAVIKEMEGRKGEPYPEEVKKLFGTIVEQLEKGGDQLDGSEISKASNNSEVRELLKEYAKTASTRVPSLRR